MRRILVLASLIVISVVLVFVNIQYPNEFLVKGFYTFFAWAAIYFVFAIVLSEVLIKRIKGSNMQYSMRKIISLLSLAVYLFALIAVWIAETQNILIALGLVGAAIAFGLQDIFKNFVGGIMIFVNGLYRVGDRIEISEKFGDVIDIGILYTTLMETRNWVAADQVTGRLTVIPNGGVLTASVHNYTKDFTFIWDEMRIPITYNSDWSKAKTKILEIVTQETVHIIEDAEKTMTKLEGRYYFSKRSLEPTVFVSLTDNWINLDIRYVADVRNRRTLNDKLNRTILQEIEKDPDIQIASETLNITEFPTVKLEPNKNN